MSQRFHATYWRSSIAIGSSAPTRDANWNVMDDKNWIMDHIVKNKGLLNYCVRWDSTEKLSKATASKSRSNRCRRCSPALAATSTAVKFGDQNAATQAAATVAPGSSDSTNQWSNDVPTVAPNAPSSTSSSQGWSQPTTTSTAPSGNTDQGSSQTTQTSSTASSANTAQSTASSSNTASSATQEGSDATQTSTNSTSSGDHATFGTITSKSGECVIGNPNTYVSTADIDWIWTNRIGPSAPTRDANWNVMDNKNWIMDHIVKNKGSLNYCVRWDSTEKLSKATASKFKAMLERQYAAWNHWLIGYDCWPYNEIKVNVVGFAVKEASLLDWTDDSLGTITVGDLDSDGVPQCDQKCYRFYDDGLGAWSDTSGCKGEPFDISLWPKQGLEGGFGYDWGQEVNLENMLSTLDQDQLVIVAHEIGHGFGLPDFYEDADKPNAQWPNCIMMAGSSMTVTDSDGWMLRRVLEHLKPRYNF
ncbi:Neutral zinc metallopeptidase [Phytophthora cinnamomi]|uniref:Neutral zinc metallopeptidase n=1 Tax=Phytophthora cinnamomi TaxID=4785 RepID=UPI00355950D0|nr:Neutral zinc metallopeptidase [Phytophthora cinnamomi]